MAKLVTNNLEEAFQEIKKFGNLDDRHSNLGQSTVVKFNDKAEQIIKGASAGSYNTTNITRMAPAIWSPVLQMSSLIMPKTIEEKNIWRRWYYQHDPVVGTAIDLHIRYPLSTFRLRCDTDDKGEISSEYEKISEKANLFQTFMDIGQEYYVVGEAIPVGIWNKSEKAWDGFTLLNPDCVNVQINPFNKDEQYICITKWTKVIKDIVTKGTQDPKTAPVYLSLLKNNSDVVEAIMNNQPFRISPMISSHIARRACYFDLRGTSIIDRLFKVFMYQEKLMEAQLAGVSRYQTPIELWTLGNDIEPASQQAIDAFEQVIRTTWNSPQKSIIWGHAVKGEMLGGAAAMLSTAPEFDWINKQKCAALMINESIINAEGPSYASASVAADFMASFYLNYRMEMEKWALKHFFEPIAKARDYYKPIPREIAGHYRDKTIKREPMLPKIMWDKANLRDDYQKLGQLIQLAGQQKIPWSLVYDHMNLDKDTVLKELKNEAKQFAALAPDQNTLPGLEGALGGGMGGGMDMGGGMGGGMGGELGMPMPPEGGAASLGGTTMPPESQGMPPQPQGTGV